MLTLYDYLPSQNAYKVRQLLAHLEVPYRTEIVSIFSGEGRTKDHLSVNPTGAVPAVRLPDGRVIGESSAILWYLADGTAYLPDDRYLRAKALQWMSFEVDYLQNSIGSLRYWTLTGKLASRPKGLVDGKRNVALEVLGILDDALLDRPYLLGERYSIADIACFAYSHLALDADLPLENYRAVCEWIRRIRLQPRFMGIVYPYSIDPHAWNELPCR